MNRDESSETSSWRFAHKERYFWYWRLSEIFLLGGIFSLGVLILIIHLITWGKPAWENAQNLIPAECLVKEQFLYIQRDSRGRTGYCPEVEIEYEVNNERYTMRTFDQNILTDNQGILFDQSMALSLLSAYPPGMKTTCWYRSDDPAQVVLRKKSTIWGWVFLIIPTTLIMFGGVGLYWRFRQHSRSQEQLAMIQRRRSRYPTIPNEQTINESPGIRLAFRLPLAFFPVFQLVCAMVLGVIWNTFSWVMFIYLLSGRSTWFDFGMAILFGLIFCGSGITVFPWIIKRIKLALRVGTTILEISDHPVVPGRKHRLTLIQNGRINAVSYQVFVICEEIARYQQGTDTITNRKEVFRQLLFSHSGLNLEPGQTCTNDFFLYLPIGVMHSMVADHNEVRWKILINIELQDTPHYTRECAIVVHPHPGISD